MVENKFKTHSEMLLERNNAGKGKLGEAALRKYRKKILGRKNRERIGGIHVSIESWGGKKMESVAG